MPESVANYLTIDPNTGGVGAEFEGHVQAAGVDLLIGGAGVPPVDRKINWRAVKGGAVVADVRAYQLASDRLTKLHTDGADGRRAWTYLESQGSNANEYADIDVAAGGGAASALNLHAQTGTQGANRLLLDSAGTSDFTQNAEFNTKWNTQLYNVFAAKQAGQSSPAYTYPGTHDYLGILRANWAGVCNATSVDTQAITTWNYSVTSSGYYAIGWTHGFYSGGVGAWAYSKMLLDGSIIGYAQLVVSQASIRLVMPWREVDVGFLNANTTHQIMLHNYYNLVTDGNDPFQVAIWRRA